MRSAVVTSIKDEAPYIVDWVAHYRALGFDEIIIFQNDSVDGTDQLCAALAEAGYIHYFNNSDINAAPEHLRHHPAQRRAYGWAQSLPLMADINYMFLIDIDEYLELPLDDSFSQLVTRLYTPDVISFAWRMFGSNGETEFSTTPVTQRFQYAAKSDDHGTLRAFNQVKSAFSPRLTQKFNVHIPRGPDAQNWRWVTPDGVDIHLEGNRCPQFDYGFANLRHYHVKSKHEFMIKMFRGYASHGRKPMPNIGLPAFDIMDVNTQHLPFDTPAYHKGCELAKDMRKNVAITAAEHAAIDKFKRLGFLVSKAIENNDVFKQHIGFKADLNAYFKTHVYDKL